MTKKRDLRVQKTYTALFSAFENLITKKTFEEITVRELCNLALIRTATFYKHFSDKYEFLSFMIKELRITYLENAKTLPCHTVEDYYLNIIKSGLEFLMTNQAFIKAADSDNMISIIMETTSEQMHETLIVKLKEDQRSGCTLISSPELTAELFIGAMNQVCRWWLHHQKEISVSRLIEELKPFVQSLVIHNE